MPEKNKASELIPLPEPPDEDAEAYQIPCSEVQRTCWFLDRMSPGTPGFNIAVRFLLSGRLDVALLQEALREVCRRHELLRTRFLFHDGAPQQIVETAVRFELAVVDLRVLPADQRTSETERMAAEEAKVGFDIERGPLFRGRLIRTEDEQYILLLTMHHIVSDGWSVGIVTDEMGQIYESLVTGSACTLAPLAIQYGDYAHWQQQWVSSGELERQLELLRLRLDGFQPLQIPTDLPRPATSLSQGEICSILLPRSLTDRLKRLSEQHGCTMFVTMLSAFLVLLHLEAGQNEVVIRTQTAGRDRVELEGLIGWFVNSIILRADVSGLPTFHDLLTRTHKLVLESFDYQHVPFERLMEVIRPAQGPPRHPPFQVNFIFQRDFVRPWRRAGVTLTPLPSKATGTFVDLNFFLVERQDGWRASVDVNTDVFSISTGEFFLCCFQKILEAVTQRSQISICDIVLPERPMQRSAAQISQIASSGDYVAPRNSYEQAVIEIWEKVLGVTQVGAYSNFFDLGGHSLVAVRLLVEFQQRFGLEIKMSELFIDPTPAAMAQVISGEAIYSDGRDLIPILGHGPRPPFFMIGADHWFRPLARHLGLDQPFIGVPLLKYRDLNIAQERISIARELAHRLIQHHGGKPFLLGGWCADGLTAYEVARALQEQGERVALMVLFDAINPDYYRDVRSLVHSTGRTITSLRNIVRSAWSKGFLSGSHDFLRACAGVMHRCIRRMIDICNSQYTSAPVSFPVLLMRPSITSALERSDLGWGVTCGPRLTVAGIPGDHGSIFREPNVAVVGKRLREQLDIAIAATTASHSDQLQLNAHYTPQPIHR